MLSAVYNGLPVVVSIACLFVIFVSTVHVDFAYRFADCCSVIGHFVEYYLEVNLAVVRDDCSARFGSVLSEAQ